MPNLEVLHKIKMGRLSKNWSQTKIATLLRVSVPTYSRFERGITKTDYSFLQKVCGLLQIDLKIEDLTTEKNVNFVEEERANYTRKKIPVSFSDIQKLIELFEQQQELNKKILSKLKALQVQN